MSDIIQKPSPNFNDRADNAPVQFVVLHYTGMKSGSAALERLCDPAAKVSAHYLVEEDGRVFQLVAEDKRAWHAGKSWWRGIEDINSHSIGIEIVNPGHEHGYRPFPMRQMIAVREVCLDLKKRYALPPRAFLAHSDIAPTRKEDPGELFDWRMLAEYGIGLFPAVHDEIMDHMRLNPPAMTEAQAIKIMAKLGYNPDEPYWALLTAFQRRYVQTEMTGEMNLETEIVLHGFAGP